MKTLLTLALGCALAIARTHAADPGAGWTSMFNGKDLSGWKSNEDTPGAFAVVDGTLKVSNGPTHLFFVGSTGNATFTNFEFKAKVMTTPGANSGIYFHTQFQAKGWPAQGFECQVNATSSDRRKTGGLYAVQDVLDEAPNKDNVWFDYYIKVEGKRIVVQIDGKTTVDWTQPENWDPATALKDMPGRKLGTGTIALQGHDPKSPIFYKDMFVRALP